jgi:hypothetical protein
MICRKNHGGSGAARKYQLTLILAQAAARSWKQMQLFFQEIFSPGH